MLWPAIYQYFNISEFIYSYKDAFIRLCCSWKQYLYGTRLKWNKCKVAFDNSDQMKSERYKYVKTSFVKTNLCRNLHITKHECYMYTRTGNSILKNN